jgi:hypothetical protein
MTELTTKQRDLLRDTLGTGLKGTRPTRNSLSFYLQDQNPAEVAELVAMGLLARIETPAVGGPIVKHAATEQGIEVFLTHQQGQ